jgi:anthranilate/para-aminobenzoate synthase component I
MGTQRRTSPCVFVTARDGKRQKDDTVKNILEYLEHHQTAALIYESDNAANLPFVGGHRGYLGYEVRHDTQRKLDNILEPVTTQNGISNPNIPTAALLFCDQFLIMDHWNDKWYLVELTISPECHNKQRLDVYNGKRTAFLSTGTNPQWLYAIATTT